MDEAERAIGTNIDESDTDGDGMNDGAEIEQGLDPLGGRGFPTGLVSTVSLVGTAEEIVVQDPLSNGQRIAYVSTGANGLAVVDASRFDLPTTLGQIALTGASVDLAVDPNRDLAAVASGGGGLHFVDISEPMLPTLANTITVNAIFVEIVDGIAYAAVGNTLRAYDVSTQDELQRLSVSNSEITGLAREGLMLYTMDEDDNLTVIDPSVS